MMYDINNSQAENTEVLAQTSRAYGASVYTYGVQRLSEDSAFTGQSTYLYDGRGSVAQTYQEGALQTYRYDAFGQLQTPMPSGSQNFFGYNAEETSPLTGLQYLRARYYAPAAGRFITPDSFARVLTNALTLSKHIHITNTPVKGRGLLFGTAKLARYKLLR